MGTVQSTLGVEVIAAGVVVAGSAAAYGFYEHVRKGKDKDTSPATTVSSAATGASAPSQDSNTTERKKRKPKSASAKADAEFERIVAAAAAENVKVKAKAKAKAAAGAPSQQSSLVAELVPGSFETADSSDAAAAAKQSKEKKPAAKKRKGKKLAPALATAVSQDDSPIESSNAEQPERSVVTKKEKKKKGGPVGAVGAQSSNTTPTPSSAGPSSNAKSSHSSANIHEEDGSWTRVESRKRSAGANATDGGLNDSKTLDQSELLTSDTNLTTSETNNTETSSVATDKTEDELLSPTSPGKTFAEKMLPKPRKTGVEDMEDEPLYPGIARVMRVTPGPNEKPAAGFSWGDYEDVVTRQTHGSTDEGTSADGDEDDGWEDVKSKRRGKFDRTLSSPASASSLTHHHRSQATAPETLTKRQRQNAAKRDAQKADKEAAEAERIARLAKHKRELERTKIEEQYKGSSTGKKSLSGGMQMRVNDNNKLVWDD